MGLSHGHGPGCAAARLVLPAAPTLCWDTGKAPVNALTRIRWTVELMNDLRDGIRRDVVVAVAATWLALESTAGIPAGALVDSISGITGRASSPQGRSGSIPRTSEERGRR
jgi:hypothetical protein